MKRWLLTSGAIILAIGLLLYGRTLHYGFVELDDPLLILENPAAQSLTLPHVKAVFSMFDPELYIPLTFVSYQFDATIGSLQPGMFHSTNVLLHTINAVLLLMLCWQLTRRRDISIIAALLFLVHPINTEAVAWISGRKDLLSTMFFLLSVNLFLSYRKKEQPFPAAYAGSLVTFLLGLLSKVTVVSLPLVLLLTEWHQKKTITRRSLLLTLPYFALSLFFGIVALFGKSAAQPLPLLTRVLTACTSLIFSVGKILVPVHLSPMYAYDGPITLTNPVFLIPLLIVLALIVLAIVIRKRLPALTYGIAFVILTYAPSFGNVVKDGEYYLSSDRYSYIPMMGIVVLVALLLGRFSVQIRKTVGIVLVLVLCVMTFAQTSVWADTESLSAYVVKTSPQARLGHMWHGNSLRDAGDIDGALHEYGIALSFSEDPQVYYNRALAYEAGGDVGAATADYQKAISLDPHYALAYINLGRVLYLEGKKPEARLQFEKAMESAPSLAMPYYDLGVLEGETKNWEKAASFYRQALDRDPLLTDARANLAIALLQLGKTDEAIIELNRTLADDPTNPTALGLQEELLRRKIIR